MVVEKLLLLYNAVTRLLGCISDFPRYAHKCQRFQARYKLRLRINSSKPLLVAALLSISWLYT